MTVKNGEQHIPNCIESILNQTFSDFEFLIFDDFSSDKTVDIVSNYREKDSRIHLFSDSRGYIGNLNRGIEISKGQYIARMDHDDIMDQTKFARQLEIMENTDTDVCGTWVLLFGEKYPNPMLEPSEAGFVQDPLYAFSTVNYMHNSTSMIRKEFIINHNLRYEPYFPAEDYKFWIEIAKRKGKFYMIPEPLLFYRISQNQSGTVYAEESRRQTVIVQKEIQEYMAKEI